MNAQEKSYFVRTFTCQTNGCGETQKVEHIDVHRPSFSLINLPCAHCRMVTPHKRDWQGSVAFKLGTDMTTSGSSGFHTLDYKTNDIVKERAIAIAAERNHGRDPRQFMGQSDD